MDFSRLAPGTLLRTGFRELRERPADQEAALDALRCFAILGVLGVHWSVGEFARSGGRETAVGKWPIFLAGWAGVDLFFVLSGFLIGRQLWRELARTGSVEMGRFLLKRGFRIWPLYFVFLGLTALLSKSVRPGWVDFLFLTNYFPNAMGNSWSLSTEEQFYIAVPLLILLFRRRITMSGYVGILLLIEVAVLVGRYFMLQRVLKPGDTINDHYFTLFAPFHTHLEGLLAGLILALFWVHSPQFFRPRVGRASWLGFAVLSTAVVSAFVLRRANHDLFNFLALGVLFGGLTFWALVDRSWLSAPLRFRFWYPISRLSYGMYLNHFWMTPSLNRAMVRVLHGLPISENVVFLIALTLATVVSIAIATATFLLIEHPFLVLRGEWLSRSARET